MNHVRMYPLCVSLIVVQLLAPGCGDDDSSEDASLTDAGSTDASSASPHDGQVAASDARAPTVDAGGTDASGTDAGVAAPDAGSTPDGGVQQGGHAAGELCGGFAGFACAAGLFCDYAAGTGCKGIADASGKCSETPSACTRESMPVCGCDGENYDNPCGAHSKGIAVMHDGACTADD